MPPPRPDLKVEALAAHHARDAFFCGVDSLDRYLRARAGQDVRRRANGVFMLVAADAVETVPGYYTLCVTSLPQGDVPAAARRYVPRYPMVSATLIGRLAVSMTRQGDGLGSGLLADAVQCAYTSAETVGSSMVVVDALNERAAASTNHSASSVCRSHCALCCRCARSRSCLRDDEPWSNRSPMIGGPRSGAVN